MRERCRCCERIQEELSQARLNLREETCDFKERDYRRQAQSDLFRAGMEKLQAEIDALKELMIQVGIAPNLHKVYGESGHVSYEGSLGDVIVSLIADVKNKLK